MNIFVVVEANTWFDNHVMATLREVGHRVGVFHYGNAVGEYYPRARRSEREWKNRELLRQAAAFKAEHGLDLIFCYVYDDFLLPETAAGLRALGAPMLNYNVDMTNQWYRQSRTARYFTGMLCAQRIHMEDLSRHGAPVHFFPMAARAPVFLGDRSLPVPASVTFLGTPMPYRNAVLRRLNEAGIPLAIYGKFWSQGLIARPDRNLEKTVDDIAAYGLIRFRSEGVGALWAAVMARLPGNRHGSQDKLDPSLLYGFLQEDDVAILFRDSKINLGFTRMTQDDPDRPGVTQLKLRDFEVPACGGFYLVERTREYGEFFVEGREVETWRTVGELIEKVRYYLEHDSERAAIAAAGQRRALRDHLWAHRFSSLFATLGIH